MNIILIAGLLSVASAQIDLIPQPKNAQVTAGTVTDTGFWVTWDLVSKAESYRITISPPTIGAVGVGSGIQDKFTAIDGLTPNTEYTVQIIPMKGSTEGTPAVVWQKTALPAPTSFFVVSDSVTADSMVVGWSKVEDAESYTLEVLPSAGVSGAGTQIYQTSVTLRGLVSNTLYTLTIKPRSWVGNGGSATVRQLTKLPPPANVRVLSETISHNTMSIHWDKVVGADTYHVKVTPADGIIGAGQGVMDTYTVLRNMKADTQYLVQVAARNGAGLSEFRQVVVKTLSICYAKGTDYNTETFKIFCPARCARNQEHVYGTRVYTGDSYICAAAVHDGRIDDNVGGDVIVKKRPGMTVYIGTTQNGVISKNYGSWHKSFVFALQTPENLRVLTNSVTYNSITIEWDPVKGADAYKVTVEPDLGVSGAVAGIQDTKTTLGNLKADFEYRIYVTATNDLESSEAAILTQFTSLPKPLNLKVMLKSVTHDRFNITWLPVAGASHYLIKIETEGVKIREETTKFFYLVDGMPSGSRIEIAVSGVNDVGAGEESFVTQYTKLNTVENVRAESITDTRMQVEWDVVSGATHYLVTTIPSPMSNGTKRTEDPYIWLENLNPDTTYDVRVQAENGFERSRSVTIKQKTALGAPLNLRLDGVTHNSVSITWDKMRNANSYYVSIMSYDNKFGANDERITNTFIATGLNGRSEYKISVLGRNEVGDGRPASIGITTLIPPPERLRIHGKSMDADQVQITWDQYHGATGYLLIVLPPAGISGTGVQKDNNAMIYGLKSSVKYQIFVCVLVGTTKGMNATTQFVTGLQAPDNVRVAERSSTSILVEWDIVVLADYYKVVYVNKGTKVRKEINTVYNTSILIGDLRPKSEYQITVKSMEEADEATGGMEKASMGATVTTMTRIDIPGGVQVIDKTEDTVTISWLPVPSAIDYRVFVEPGDDVQGAGNVTTPPMTLYNLKPDVTYTVSIFAMDDNMNISSYAAQIYVKPGEMEQTTAGWLQETTDSADYNYYNDIDNNKGIFGPNGNGDKQQGPDGTPIEEPRKWVIIVIIVAAIVLLILLAIIPCVCDCCYNKPIIKYHGCCGCCASCSDYGCCACRGCCPGGPEPKSMLHRNQSYASTVMEQPGRLKSSGHRHVSYTVQSNY